VVGRRQLSTDELDEILPSPAKPLLKGVNGNGSRPVILGADQPHEVPGEPVVKEKGGRYKRNPQPPPPSDLMREKVASALKGTGFRVPKIQEKEVVH